MLSAVRPASLAMPRSRRRAQSTYTWAATTTDPRALQTAGGTSRIAACWYSYTSFTVDVNLTDGQTHDLELYFVDWDTTKRSESVTLSNAVTGTVLSTETVSSFNSGVYLKWAVSGNVLITFTTLSGVNAVLSGLFFDPTPPTATATFVSQDSTTVGTWIGTYGTQGSDVIGSTASIPSYATVTSSGAVDLHLGRDYNRSTSSPDGRWHEPHRGLLVLVHQLHGRRQSNRWSDPRPRTLLRRLGHHQA